MAEMIDIRLRVRVCDTSGRPAKEISQEIQAKVLEVPDVESVKEHSWTRWSRETE